MTNIDDTELGTTEKLQANNYYNYSNLYIFFQQPTVNSGDQADSCQVSELKADRRDLTSCGLLYPALMKQAEPVVTRSAVISHQDREEEPSEVVETFQAGAEYCQDGSLINEIKIAEIVQMTCEEAEDGSFVCLYKEGEFR